MHNELVIKIGTKNHKAFLQDGFYSPSTRITPFHKHNYAEVHIVTDPTANFDIEGTSYPTRGGNLFVIPGGVSHCLISNEKNAFHTAFQIDYEISELKTCNINSHTLQDFFCEIQNCRVSDDYSKISAYISLFCSYFCSDEKFQVQPITDYGFLIHEFFSQHYSEDLHLKDLAETLHLSERQAERLVIEYTGNTFREELTSMRISTAKHLLKTSNMSLSKIAQYVGYHSYAGFWKAMNKQENLKRACCKM